MVKLHAILKLLYMYLLVFTFYVDVFFFKISKAENVYVLLNLFDI